MRTLMIIATIPSSAVAGSRSQMCSVTGRRVMIEVPNPLHPYGVRGVGEVPIVPALAAVANAMRDATGIRFTALPLSPPRVLEAIEAAATVRVGA